MSVPTDIGNLIVRSPEIRGGRPRIAGTGVTVRRIVGWYKLGLNAEEIADRIRHLTIAQVYAALTYYRADDRPLPPPTAGRDLANALQDVA